jgi:hypothetical protein
MKLSSGFYVLSMTALLLQGGEHDRCGLAIVDLKEVKN